MQKLCALIASAILMSAAATGSLRAQEAVDQALVEKTLTGVFGHTPDAWQKAIVQDETQKVCSAHHDQPPAAEAEKIMARERKTVVFPPDGKVVGDWKKGEALAQNGYGGRHTDNPKRVKGGNCYACHQLSKKEVSFGTMGPPLVEYGKVRDYSVEEAKKVYAKIYNAQASFACSKMPRFGHNKHLTEQQIKDIVALLFDKESPVNK